MVSASEDSTPSIIYHCVLRGLERLLLSEQLSRVDGEALVKLSVDRVNMPSPHRAMAALGLMLTCMYTGKSGSSTKTTANASQHLGQYTRGLPVQLQGTGSVNPPREIAAAATLSHPIVSRLLPPLPNNL